MDFLGWKVFAASAIGKGHIDIGLPCQDAFAYHIDATGLVAVVCDGAGSAAHSAEGATLISGRIRDGLMSVLGGMTESNVQEEIVKAIESARTELENVATQSGRVFREFASTIVGCVANTAGAWFFHLGDGFGIARTSSEAPVLSSPENGEYNNETWFVTDTRWQAHLRVTPIGKSETVTCLALMSDGAAPFAMNRGATDFFEPFITPVLKFLETQSTEDGSAALAGTLLSEKTYEITADDKTLLLVIKVQ